MGNCKNIATPDWGFGVIKGTILHENCSAQFCHTHSLAESLCDNEHRLPVFKLKPEH